MEEGELGIDEGGEDEMDEYGEEFGEDEIEDVHMIDGLEDGEVP